MPLPVHVTQRCRAAHHGGQLAEHSVEVLLRIHAKCLDGGCALIRQCVQASLGHADTYRNVDTRWTQMLAHSRGRPDLVGHTTRPLTFVPAGQRPYCAGGGW